MEDRNLSLSRTYQRGVCGLLNLGNTCFMNSALQCLSNVPQLTEYLLAERYLLEINEQNPLGTGGRLVAAYAELLQEMWSGAFNSVRPWRLKYVIGEFAPRFNGYAQQDSQELTAFILDGLHEDLNRIKKKPQIEDKEDKGSEGHDDAQAASDAWLDYKRRNDSVIVDLLHGQLKSTLICSVCKKRSIKYDPFCFLSVPIPAKERQEKSTALFVRKDKWKKDTPSSTSSQSTESIEKERWKTMNGGAALGMRQSVAEYSRSSLSLALQTLRFTQGIFWWVLTTFLHHFRDLLWDFWINIVPSSIPLDTCLRIFFSPDSLTGEDMYNCEQCKKLRNGTKQCSLTRLPQIQIIHLKRFRHEGNYNLKLNCRIMFPLFDLDLRPFIHPTCLNDASGRPVPTKYDLIGLISHRGQNMEFGHYVAYCRNPLDNNWYEFDDSSVTQVSQQEVMSQEAYVLFYEMNSTMGEEEEEQEDEDSWTEEETMKTADEGEPMLTDDEDEDEEGES